MSVKVKISSMFQSATAGAKMAEVTGSTVGECLRDLVRQYPDLERMLFDEKDRLPSEVVIFVNEESAAEDGINRPVKDGDEIYPLILIGGG